ncbi:hypothetical protein ACFQYP_38515 [Nonomuraea antimicrobica]
MRDNGVDMPDPNADGTFPGGTGSALTRESPELKKALEACRAKSPGVGVAK